ncbi:MAG TPA: branched-chain amino acid ABC transporter permease [Kofleriaceae bacterium]|nr:branched-chain amino acid ABC transporter permease [Kofleriaceae bacterium]
MSSSSTNPPRWKPENTVFAVITAVLVIARFVVYPELVMNCMCMALFACSLNLLLGYVGLLSFGHAMFFGGAAYATAHVAKQLGWPPELAIVFGVAFSTVLGAVVGWLAIRRQGIYFAMITLGLAQLFFFICNQVPLTHGEDGIQGVPRGTLLGFLDLTNTTAMYGFVLVIFLLGFLFVYRVIHSPFGAVLTAIRENEPRAISLGYDVDHYKLIAFVLSAGLAGLAGATKSLVFQLAAHGDVNWTMSGLVILMTLIGGLGRFSGPVIGAFVVVALENYLARFQGMVSIVEGAVFVVCVLVFRQGIMGKLSEWLKTPL